MPFYYSFTEKTGQLISLEDMDSKMCVAQNLPCSGDYFCDLFQIATIVGCTLSIYKYGEIDRENLIKYCQNNNYPDEKIALLVRFLVDDYTFNCQYSR